MEKISFIEPMTFEMLPKTGEPIFGYCFKGFKTRPVSTKELADQLKNRLHLDFIYVEK